MIGEPPDRARGATGPRARGRALREALALLSLEAAPLDLRIAGRTLLHAALVGTLAGLAGVAFFAGLEAVQALLLGALAGFEPARARGEPSLGIARAEALHALALALLPALGGLASGLVTRLAPEAAGGGGDAMIDGYHRGGRFRFRLLPVKLVASLCTLGSGGSGGREGPTMLMGAAVGNTVGRFLPTTPRERRVLVLAGVAAGIAAVFRTPLGAALLAVEVMYRDDFEAEGLVPAILASVFAYAIAIAFFGEATLFGARAPHPFSAAELPLFALLALVVAGWGAGFSFAIHAADRGFRRLGAPDWLRPALGGVATGLAGIAVALALARLGPELPRLTVLGGGYGTAQAAISGAPGLPGGWTLVGLLLLLAGAKVVATACTIGSGGSAGDFAPALVIGALVGGAFGQAVALATGDPTTPVGAFALVGMGTLYGGLAKVPLAAVVLVAELAGGYDLLVPMMLAVGIALVVLRRARLYRAQPASRRESPLHRREAGELGALEAVRVSEVLVPAEVPPLPADAPFAEVARAAATAERQEVIPVRDAHGAVIGLVDLARVRGAAAHGDLEWAVAADLMGPFLSVAPEDTLRRVATLLLEAGARQVAVVANGAIAGYAGADELSRVLVAPQPSEGSTGGQAGGSPP